MGWYGNKPPANEEFILNLNNGYQVERIKYNNTIYDLIILDPSIINPQIFIGNYGKGVRIKDIIETEGKENILFITNAGMFTEDKKALGYLSSENIKISDINLQDSNYGNFFLKPNGVFYIIDQIAYIKESGDFKEEIINNDIIPYLATQSGPLLLKNGTIHSAFNKDSDNKYIRNGVGVINKTSYIVFVISNNPVNFYDFSIFFKNFLDCNNALYLDGNISIMYIPALNRQQKRGNFGPVIYAKRISSN